MRLGSGATSGAGRTAAPRLLLALLTLAALKLWLVHGEDVVAVHGNLDQLRYAQMADHLFAGRWLGPYDQLTLVRSPGFPACA